VTVGDGNGSCGLATQLLSAGDGNARMPWQLVTAGNGNGVISFTLSSKSVRKLGTSTGIDNAQYTPYKRSAMNFL
jgi:hypothetical protein